MVEKPVPEKPIPEDEDHIACQVCLTEIPKSAAMSQEADAYTLHFCGVECYDKWKTSQEEKD
jgi:hypothetical protein